MMNAPRIAAFCLAAVILRATPSPAANIVQRVDLGRVVLEVAPSYQSPTPHEEAIFEPVRAESYALYAAAKEAGSTLREIREAWKFSDETTGTIQMEWTEKLLERRASQNPQYLAYLAAERTLNAKIETILAGQSRKERLLEPLWGAYVRVMPYIEARENTIPTTAAALDRYRRKYEETRSTTPIPGLEHIEFKGLKAGMDPDFDGFTDLMHDMENLEGLPHGFFHAVAWRESMGNVLQGAENADERGIFQIQSTDYQPRFGVPLPEPAGSHWNLFEDLCRWTPFNLAVAGHCYRRLAEQAELFGFKGPEVAQLAYRFYNESSGYVLFCQIRMQIYRALFGLTPQELSETDLPMLDRFIYFTREDLLRQYDWETESGMIAGELLWNAWMGARFKVNSDLLWLVLQQRLSEGPQDFVLSTDEAGQRWCKVDLTRQNVKRRGSIGIPSEMMTAIGICSARGVVPTAALFEGYFDTIGPRP